MRILGSERFLSLLRMRVLYLLCSLDVLERKTLQRVACGRRISRKELLVSLIGWKQFMHVSCARCSCLGARDRRKGARSRLRVENVLPRAGFWARQCEVPPNTRDFHAGRLSRSFCVPQQPRVLIFKTSSSATCSRKQVLLQEKIPV